MSNTDTNSNSKADIEVRRNRDANRYELLIGGDLATVVDYHDDGEQVVFPQTMTATRFRGKGLASQAVRVALEDAQQAGQTIVPSCWFVAEYIERHPEFQPLVAS